MASRFALVSGNPPSRSIEWTDYHCPPLVAARGPNHSLARCQLFARLSIDAFPGSSESGPYRFPADDRCSSDAGCAGGHQISALVQPLAHGGTTARYRQVAEDQAGSTMLAGARAYPRGSGRLATGTGMQVAWPGNCLYRWRRVSPASDVNSRCQNRTPSGTYWTLDP